MRLGLRMDNGGFWERKQDNSAASVLGRVCLLVNTLQSKQVNGEPGDIVAAELEMSIVKNETDYLVDVLTWMAATSK